MRHLRPTSALLVALALLSARPSFAQDLRAPDAVPFDETFVLDRKKAMAQLIPGSPDHFYYTALDAQLAGQWDAAQKIIEAWDNAARQGRCARDGRWDILRNRQWCLLWAKDAGQSAKFISDHLGLHFGHVQPGKAAAEVLPSALPANFLDQGAALEQLLVQRVSIENIADSALPLLAGKNLDRDQRHQLLDRLGRLGRPDFAGTVGMVSADMQDWPAFGSRQVDAHLTLAQLRELAQLRPGLLGDSAFVEAVAVRLRPRDGLDTSRDPQAQLAHLDALVEFSRTLPPNASAFKAAALFHKLAALEKLGRFDRALLLEYLELPRHSEILPMDLRKAVQEQRLPMADLNRTCFALPAVMPMEDLLVRRQLLHFLGENAATTPTDFNGDPALAGLHKFVRRDLLLETYAEARLTGGCTDPEAVYKLVSPEFLARLRDQVEVQLLPENPAQLSADAVPELKLRLKHVGKLAVRIHKLDLGAYYRTKDADFDPSVELDGLVPAVEKDVVVDAANPFLRRDLSVKLDELKEPGTYVVELVGEGHSARAVIRKGRLFAFARPSAAGHMVFVHDEAGKPVAGAQVALGNQQWTTDDQGRAAIPFTKADAEVGLRHAIITFGRLAERLPFEREKERANLEVDFDAARENFVAGQSAQVVLTPRFDLNGQPADLTLLKDWRLEVDFTLQDGTVVHRRMDELKVDANGRIALALAVPVGAQKVALSAHARLPGAKPEEDVFLHDQTRVALGANTATRGLFVRRDDKAQVLELLGANGEPVAGERVTVNFSGGTLRGGRGATLMTDAKGRVSLGVVPVDVVFSASAAGVDVRSRHEDREAIPGLLNLAEGEGLRLPWPAGAAWRPVLHELRAGQKAVDASDKLQMTDGALVLAGLPAGDYALSLPGREVALKVEAGPRTGDLVLGRDRILAASPVGKTAVLTQAKVEGDDLVLRFDGKPEKLAITVSRLGTGAAMPVDLVSAWQAQLAPVVNQYLNGRVLGEELRYVFERKQAPAFAGNMLERPGLLLNPWETQATQTGLRGAMDGKDGDMGEVFKGVGGFIGGGGEGGGMRGPGGAFVTYPLDFLAAPAEIRSDLMPDKDGVLRIPLKALGDRNIVSVSATDGVIGWTRQIALPLADLQRRDLRLPKTLPLDQHLGEKRSVVWSSLDRGSSTLAAVDGSAEAEKARGSKTLGPVKTAAEITTLSQYYQLLSALNPSLDGEFAKFEPLTRWAQLKDEEKLAFYDKQACHELHVFLANKDKAFFDKVIKPFLVNKKDKTFVDQALLGEDLAAYALPEAFARLNAFERALLARAMKDAPLVRHESEVAGQLPVDVNFLDRVFRTGMANAQKESEKGRDNAWLASQGGDGDGVGDRLSNMHGSFAMGGAFDARPAPATAAAPAKEEMAKSMDKMEEGKKTARSKWSDNTVHEAQLRMLAGKDGKALYRDPGAAKEFAESNWYRTRQAQLSAELIPASLFWADYSAGDTPSANLLLAHRNLHEALLALAVVDLPFKAEPASRRVSIQSTLTPDAAATREVSVVQRFYRADDRQVVEKGRTKLKQHKGPFRPGVIYGCEVVVTNPTEVSRELALLTQIPAGALPVGGKATDGKPIEVAPFGAWRGEYQFYFPAEGDFAQYPAQVADQGKVAGSADAAKFQVSKDAPAPIEDAWVKVAAEGSAQDVQKYLETRDLAGLDLSLCAWMMKDKAQFDKAIAILRARHYFDPVLWSYGVLHHDTVSAKEFLATTRLSNEVGVWFDSPVLAVDATKRATYEHLDYAPFINARMLQLGKERTIQNDAMRGQYARLLEVLRYKPEGTQSLLKSRNDDYMALAYYLALQDRTAEAKAQLDAIPDIGSAVSTPLTSSRLQYDYLRAYLLFSQEKPEEARAIAAKYKDLSIPLWRKRFAAVIAQADDIKAGALASTVADDAAAAAPVLEAKLVEGKLATTSSKAGPVTAALYPVDLEVLFSAQPFAVAEGTSAKTPVVQPATVLALAPDAAGKAQVDLPAAYAGKAMVVEVAAGGLRRTLTHQPHTFETRVMETQGQLQVVGADGKPVSKAYVKVYAKRGGQVAFHKDGMTDLRGRFDYASLNTGLDGVESFAVLVVAPGEQGASVKVVKPPQR